MKSSVRVTPLVLKPWLYCLHCGRCCYETEMILLDCDVERISRYTGLRPGEFAVRREKFLVLKNINGKCIFYDVYKGTCKIYPVRPIGCSLYPLVLLDDGSVAVDEYCPLSRLVPSYDKKRVEMLARNVLRKILSQG
ncbi:MAG: YkgJ family cysteine cluster protein [Thermofilum sp.]|jgi:Fe-S-cluster containining protein|nr:YkgJ family cysteine cluster protein [Thermofilum sp.]